MKTVAIICGIVGLLLVVGLLMLLPFFHRADRRVAVIGGEVILAGAYHDYTNSGILRSGAPSYQVWLASNTVTIGGTQYQCFLELRSERLGEDGTLAMTTNRAVIWLGHDGTAKFIGPGYTPTLFGY